MSQIFAQVALWFITFGFAGCYSREKVVTDGTIETRYLLHCSIAMSFTINHIRRCLRGYRRAEVTTGGIVRRGMLALSKESSFSKAVLLGRQEFAPRTTGEVRRGEGVPLAA